MFFKVFAEPAAEGAANAATEMAAEASPAMSALVSFAPFILLIIVFYFLLIRPQRKKDKENREMLQNLKVGDEVCTIGGIVGKITKIKDDKIYVTTGKKDEEATLFMERWAIRNVIKPIKAD